MTPTAIHPSVSDLPSDLYSAAHQATGYGSGISHNRKIQRLTLAGFAFAFTIMAVIAILAFHQAQIFKKTAGEMAQSQDILHDLEQVRAAIAGAETSQRGYLITGDASYLQTYRKMLASIGPDEMKHIEGLVNDNPHQSAQLVKLKLNIGARTKTFDQVIAAYQTHGFKAAQELVAQDIGRGQTIQVYRNIDDMAVLIQGHLIGSHELQAAAEARLRYSIAALAVVLLAALSLIYLLVTRSVTAARRAEKLLGRLNVALETRVTERTLQLEERTGELEQRSRQLEERSAQLESFSYSVSHDLRAPLRAISGFSQILARRHRNELSEEGRHFFDNIVQASAHMGRLIDDLLSYSRLGRKAIVLRPVAMGQILHNISNTMQSRIVETRASLHIPDDLPAVTGDHTLLTQIFTNLIDNGLTYRKPDLPAQVSLHWRNADDGQVVISVADSGIGIAPEHFEKIFSVFQRLHSTDEYPGTGIGLAVVQKSVDMLDGKIWLESSPGSGTTFHVQLSAAPATSI
ncbi:MAG: CHASE3 domain-containing protein [Burkholderiales bacterium]|jgi:signal transduction histidine kinase|nr:CHASE3 domain-containing protein [Burkholderiales bacterium]